MSRNIVRALEAVHRSGQKAYGFWGNHTATIDWCEDNYTHTQYIAEWYNTVSNIPFIALGLYGAYYSLTEIPSAMHRWRFAAPHFGIACVGLGSFIFHATLNWYAQVLLDEMPMIYVSSMVLYLVLAPTDGPGPLKLKLGITSVPLIVTILYLRFPYPVIHQLCFAGIMLSIAYRLVGLLRNSKYNSDAIFDAKYYIITGVVMFIVAFGIWNIDNSFCDFWTVVRTRLWKDEIGPSFKTPSLSAAIVGAVTQGHAWWHLLTGLGCARMASGASYLMLSTSHPDMFVLHHPMISIVPSVRRSPEFQRPEAEEYLLGDRLIISVQEF
ncbi:Alkaline ceramidase 3 OS=Homo sapiens GN=ACER3 PE=1 SV=3 [Rhizoctonia solani AG-1 IB]|uniref:Alkaline ceramidase 3 n=1 Tax=Thanatephorus cucumeris (strain AG1-IB / isolate 7/3/14) TaxID=1108050 RepID=A0A0B7F639_THACB|nr:Alkaline ceramidase 3 OS=Homo sapiens GN=ACER3 PE=1 SV=3 [Rhizoctonia solani AG-1 IB]